MKKNLFAILMTLGFANIAAAHKFPYSYLNLRLTESGLDGTLAAHTIDFAAALNLLNPAALLKPEFLRKHQQLLLDVVDRGLSIKADGKRIKHQLLGFEPLPEKAQVRLTLRFWWDRLPASLEFHCLLFPHDPRHKTYMNLFEGKQVTQRIFTNDATEFRHWLGHRQARWAVFREFVWQGIMHILYAPEGSLYVTDHILFVIGLILLGGSFWQLAKIVTAFTIAHSITLALAVLKVVQLPSWLVEPAIALSIVYIGVDNLLHRGGRDTRALVAFLFGFIHGFGFAGALQEFGLPSGALGLSLFSFNFGVEIGQLFIVLTIAPLLTLLRRRNHALAQRVVQLGSCGIASAGAFWFVQRTFFQQ